MLFLKRPVSLVLLVFVIAACNTIPFLNTPAPAATLPPSETWTPWPTSTPTLTPTPSPTRRSPYPAGVGTPVRDVGFVAISAENLPNLRRVLLRVDQSQLAVAVSADQQKILAAATSGLFLFNRNGEQLAAWANLLLYGEKCSACLAVNSDASRFAILTRNEKEWLIAVYDVNGSDLTPAREISLGNSLPPLSALGQVALSPDGKLLAYNTVESANTQVIDLQTGDSVFTYKRNDANALYFSPGGSLFALRRGQELLTWEVSSWKALTNLLLPNESTPFTFSYDGKRLAVALSSKIRIHTVGRFPIEREIRVAPEYIDDRAWMLAFEPDGSLRGQGWEPPRRAAPATFTLARWNVETGEALSLETKSAETQQPLEHFWGFSLPQIAGTQLVASGPYSGFRFTALDTLLVNLPHAACWLGMSTGQVDCLTDEKAIVHGQDATVVYLEYPEETPILVKNRNGTNVFSTGPYPVLWVGRYGDVALVDIKGITTDLYIKNNPQPVQSVPGVFRSVSESGQWMVFNTREKNGTYYMTMVEKATQNVRFQKRDATFFDPLVITPTHTIYFLSRDRRAGHVVLNMILPGGDLVTEVTRFPLEAEPRVMAYMEPAPTEPGIFAIGFQDGRVLLVSSNSLKTAMFQALYSPITHISFSPDARYLGVAGERGFAVYAMLP